MILYVCDYFCSLIVSGVDTCACVDMLVGGSMAYIQEAFSGIFCSVAAEPHSPGSSPPIPFHPSFHCFNSVTGASYCVEAHGWVAMIFQPWEQSSSWSWLPIVEAPGCLRYLDSILGMHLLMYQF